MRNTGAVARCSELCRNAEGLLFEFGAMTRPILKTYLISDLALSREALVRRATLDLTGLPPTPTEVDAFVNDRSPDAYARLLDRLLASPRFGENLSRHWLDAVRYADTHGLHLDNVRTIWPYFICAVLPVIVAYIYTISRSGLALRAARDEATAAISSIGNSRSARMFSISRPTFPVAPATTTR